MLFSCRKGIRQLIFAVHAERGGLLFLRIISRSDEARAETVQLVLYLPLPVGALRVGERQYFSDRKQLLLKAGR